MSIVAECPHCETRFNLQPDLVGKSMRCPNLDCRQVFTVQPVKPGKSSKPGRGKSGSVEEFVPVVEAKPARAKPKEAKPARPAKPAPPDAGFEVVEGESAGPKEVVWSGDAAPPLPPGAAAPPAPPAKPAAKPAAKAAKSTKPLTRPVVRQRRKKKDSHTGRYILLGVGGLLLVGMVAGVYSLVVTGEREGETEIATKAKTALDESKFTEAAKAYEELVSKYPESDNRPQYEFYGKLANLNVTARSVGVRADPKAAIASFNEFADKYNNDPLAKPTGGGAGKAVWVAGLAVVEAVLGHVQDKLTEYKSNRTKADDLTAAEEMAKAGHAVAGKMPPFRPEGATPIEPLVEKLKQAEADVAAEKTRRQVFAEISKELQDPTHEAIERAIDRFAAVAPGDPEAAALIKKAQGEFLKRIVYTPDPAAPKTPPAAATPSLLFVTPIGTTRPRPKEAAGIEPAVYLAVANGILYAIDEDSGNQIWTARVGKEMKHPPAVATLDLDGKPTELAIVASYTGGEPGLTGVVLKTGKVRWYQTLTAAAAGPAVVVGTRAFVPLADAMGTITEVNLLTGERVGKIELRQRIGPGVAVRPGSGMLYVAAEARRVFVVDVGRKPDEPDRVPPRCTQVFMTGHFPGTLPVPPVVLDPDGEGPDSGWLIILQTQGSRETKARAFRLPPPATGDGPAEVTPTAEAELTLRGWPAFAPVTDGERIAIVTDYPQVQFAGVNQPGNNDRPLFPLPSPTPPTDYDQAALPGLVVPADEGAFWVLSAGRLQKLRLTLVPTRGLEAVAEGRPNPLGFPTQPAQLNRRRDAACLVVRSPNSAGIRAVLVNLRDGEIRWKRQLGVIPPVAPLVAADRLTVTDEDGGVFTLPPAAVEIPAGEAKAVPPEFVTVAAPENVTGPTRVAVSLDGETVFTITPVEVAGAPQFVVRRVVEGKREHTGSVKAPGALAGVPAVVGGTLIFPASDGFIHRHVPGDMRNRPDTIVAGPRWSDGSRDAGAECFLVAVSDTSFLATDGGRKLTRWDWPTGRDANAGGAAWELRERIAMPPLFLPPTQGGAGARLLVADTTGNVALFPADRGGNHIRRWSTGVAVPKARPLGRFALQTGADGKHRVAYAVDRTESNDSTGPQSVVSLDVENDAALWKMPVSDDVQREIVGSPQPAEGGRWLVTDQRGRIAVLDGQSGKTVVAKEIGLPGAFPSMSAVTVGKDRVLCPLADGSAAVIGLTDAAPPEPKAGGQ